MAASGKSQKVLRHGLQRSWPGKIRCETQPGDRDIVLDELGADACARTKPALRRNEPILEIGDNVLADEAICGLLEDWLIPSIVDGLVRDLMNTIPKAER